MYQSSNQYKILRIFFDRPTKTFLLRELSRQTKISLPSVRNHVRKLLKEGFITEVADTLYTGYRLNLSQKVRAYKRNDLLARLEECGLTNFLEKKYRPESIVLFGSAVEGRDDERGDIDLFIQSGGESTGLEKYEKQLNRKISLLFEPDIRRLNKELINNLANGITLKGYMKVIQ